MEIGEDKMMKRYQLNLKFFIMEKEEAMEIKLIIKIKMKIDGRKFEGNVKEKQAKIKPLG